MTRLCNILSSSFGSLAVVLLVLGVLTVSPYALGDDISCLSDGDCPSGMTCAGGICQVGCHSHATCNDPNNKCQYDSTTMACVTSYNCNYNPSQCSSCTCYNNGMRACYCK